MRKGLLLSLLLIRFGFYFAAAEGTFVNPITDVCWDCLFPITVSGVNVTPSYGDFETIKTPVCICEGIPPKVGLPISFWEPTRLVDVTRHAYKLIGLGGISVGKDNVKNRGTIGITGDGPSQTSFYHVHWYVYPLLSWLEIFTDFTCAEQGDLDVGYMTELDPLWNDDQWSFVIHAEAALFSNPVAQLACAADCASASVNSPLDSLFWCAGCEGSLYPFTGTVAHHVGGVQASSLLVHRMIAKLHRSHLLKVYKESEFCSATYTPIIKKSAYKTQMIYPVIQSVGPCHALGSSDALWGFGKSFPFKGEDFVYLIWTKKHCCLDGVKPAIGGAI